MSKKMKKDAGPADGEKSPVVPREWNIKWIPTELLAPYANNARKNDDTVPYLMNSIKRFGFKQPLVVTVGNEVVCGHTRLKAALQLGFTKLPCVLADDLTEEEIKAFRLVDNKIQELSSWDFDKLSSELDSLKVEFDEDMKDFGFGGFLAGSVDDLFDESLDADRKKKDEDDGVKDGEPIKIKCTCPECGHVFEQEVK